MKRSQFLKLSALAGIGLGMHPTFAFQSKSIPLEELIGKGSPTFYGTDFKLRKEAFDAFENMRKMALKDQINIQVVSSYRSFAHQNRIWSGKYKRFTDQGMTPENAIKKIIEYSTIPGTSRHHWGTDLDIIDSNAKQPKNVLHPDHFEGNGCFRPLKIWMDENAQDFGFHLVYTDNPDRKGFKYEPWHYSYKPISCEFLKAYQSLDFKAFINKENIVGNAHFSDEFLNEYYQENILDINPELL